MPDWIKSRDADLRTQVEDFSAYIAAHAVALGLVADDCTMLATKAH